MSGALTIGLLGFGEVGQMLASGLVSGRIRAFDVQFADRDSTPSLAVSAPSLVATGARALASQSDIIISCVTAAHTIDAARSVADALKPNAWFLDLNSASPAAKRNAAEHIAAGGGRYVEASVMSPIAPKRMDTPILIGGPHAAQFLSVAEAIGLGSVSVFSNEYGPTAAVKMCRSIMVKGIEALLTESMITARHYGVEGAVLDSLKDLFPGPDWRKLARYMISRALEHGVRRAEELREVARMVAESGLDPVMSTAIAKRQDWAALQRAALKSNSLEEMLDLLGATAEKDELDGSAQ